nr:MAG TPA: hypothetical protein [Bacteriophage sp.]
MEVIPVSIHACVTFNDFVIVVRLLDSSSVFNIKSDTNLCPPPPSSTYESEEPLFTNPEPVIVDVALMIPCIYKLLTALPGLANVEPVL